MRIHLTDASIKTWSDDGDDYEEETNYVVHALNIHFVLMKLRQVSKGNIKLFLIEGVR